MGRLAGFRYKDVTKKMKQLGFVFLKHGAGDHDIWQHSTKNLQTTIPNKQGKGIKEGTLRAILQQCNIDPNSFLEA